jgi:hypothetical protein
MEFLAGVISTIVISFIGYKIFKVFERRRIVRDAYIPPSTRPRPGPKDYPDSNIP